MSQQELSAGPGGRWRVLDMQELSVMCFGTEHRDPASSPAPHVLLSVACYNLPPHASCFRKLWSKMPLPLAGYASSDPWSLRTTVLKTPYQLLKSLLKDPLLILGTQVAVHVPAWVEASSQDL